MGLLGRFSDLKQVFQNLSDYGKDYKGLHERLQSPVLCALIEGADAAHRRLTKPGKDEVNGPYRQRVFELELSML